MGNREVIENIYDQLAKGDFTSMFDVVADDVEWIEAENIPYSPGAPLIGHDAVRTTVFDELAKDYSDFHINVTRTVADGPTVLVEGRYVGTTKAGKDLDAIFAHVWDFAGEEIVRFQQYSDTWQWRRVLGVDA